MIRRAREEDIPAVAKIYDEIIDEEAAGRAHVGWQKGIYPTEHTAREAHRLGELFVDEDEKGIITAAARINQEQMPAYRNVEWENDMPDQEVMVLHTLVVSPAQAGHGLGTKFVDFYEKYALQQGCRYLRMDTNEKNLAARRLYKKLGYAERGIIPCNFNGIDGVNLVCLEKKL